MPRLSLGLGLNLIPRILGGGQAPTDYVAKYSAFDPNDFSLVTGDSVNVWQDESVNNNDLTQATSANQPKLVEDFTVTQFTASNQPTLVDDAGTWKLDFDTNDYMEGLKPQSGDFSYLFEDINIPDTSQTRAILSSSTDSNILFFVSSSDMLAIRGSDGSLKKHRSINDF